MSVALPPSETRKTIRIGLVLSGFLVAFGFMTMLVPIALYHAAQVAAALRLRSAYSWLALVILITTSLGFLLLSDVLVVGGFVGILWFPIFVFALYQRKTNAPFGWTALAFFVPLLVFVSMLFFIPIENNFDVFLLERLNNLKSDASVQAMSNSAELLATLEQRFQQFRLSAEFRFIDNFLKLAPSQRLVWFLFDAQGAVLFVLGFIINSFASLLFLDHAFEQVEKIQAVAAYVKEKPNQFPSELVGSLNRFPKSRYSNSMNIVRHSALGSAEKNANKRWWSSLWRPAHSLYSIDLIGYTFEVDAARSRWWLRGFMLPFGLIAVSSLFLLGLLGNVGSPEALVTWIGEQPTKVALPVAFLSLFSVFCLSLTAIQGLLTLYSRLTTLAMAMFVIGAMILVFSVSFNIYLAVGGLAVVGLLDYIYDLRGRLASGQKKS